MEKVEAGPLADIHFYDSDVKAKLSDKQCTEHPAKRGKLEDQMGFLAKLKEKKCNVMCAFVQFNSPFCFQSQPKPKVNIKTLRNFYKPGLSEEEMQIHNLLLKDMEISEQEMQTVKK